MSDVSVGPIQSPQTFNAVAKTALGAQDSSLKHLKTSTSPQTAFHSHPVGDMKSLSEHSLHISLSGLDMAPGFQHPLLPDTTPLR